MKKKDLEKGKEKGRGEKTYSVLNYKLKEPWRPRAKFQNTANARVREHHN